MKKFILLPPAVLALASVSLAQTIVTPDSADATSTIGGSRTITEVINGSDLSGGGTSGDILSETHDLSTDSAGYFLSGSFSSTSTPTFEITFDLGGTFDIDGVHLWNYDRNNDNPTRALKNFDISFSTDGGTNYGTTYAAGTFSDFAGADNPRVDNEIAVQSRFFTSVSDVTDIKIDNIVLQGDNSYIGFSEIRFNAVPEPSAFALLAGCFGLAWVMLRRRA